MIHSHTITCTRTHTHIHTHTHTRIHTHAHTHSHTLQQVTWYFPGARAQSTLTSYNITYRLAGDSTPIAQHTQPISALTEYTVSASEATPVKPYTTYSVRVWAKYSNGENVGSETVTVVTGEDVPSAPQSVTVDVVNNTALLVQWQVRG